MLLRIAPPCSPNPTRFSASIQGRFQRFSILFQSLFLSPLPTIPLLNREIQSPTSFHPTYGLDYSCRHSFLGTILDSLSSLLLSWWISDHCGFRLSTISWISSLCFLPLGFAVSSLVPSVSGVWPIHSHHHYQNIVSYMLTRVSTPMVRAF